MEEDDYNLDDASDDEANVSGPTHPARNLSEVDDAEEEDLSLADWFDVKGSSNTPEALHAETDSETEPDSDNEDVNRDEDINPEEDDGDDWVDVRPVGASPAVSVQDASVRKPSNAKLYVH